MPQQRPPRPRAPKGPAPSNASTPDTTFCADPPVRSFARTPRDIAPGPRSREVECFARFHEAHIAAVPGDPEVVNQMAGACCTDRVRNSKGPARLVIFPRSHIEAALFYSNVSRRDVDINFMGRIHTKQQSANRARRWILDFAKRTFTNASLFLDTTVQNPSTYQRLGAYDISVVEGHAAGFKPMGVMGEQQQNPCVMAKCSTDYFHRLARSRFTLAPAGDKPWSQRFFEAIMAGSVPILQSPQHAGRNFGEQTLGYKFLLVSEFEKRLRANGGVAPYCGDWARHNLDIFLRRQSYIQRRQTIHANVDRCRSEAFD